MIRLKRAAGRPKDLEVLAELEVGVEQCSSTTHTVEAQVRTADLFDARPAKPTIVRPLAPERYRVEFTLSRDGHERLARARDLLRHSIPTGDAAAIFERALVILVAELEETRCAAAARPRASRPASGRSRRVPAAVRRDVFRRDGGPCAYVGTEGRCTERGFLELHHVVPFADGGAASVETFN